LKLKFPGRYDFSRASTAFDVIKSGSSAFLMGYRIIFEMEVVLSKSIRADIDALSLYINSYYQNHEMQQIGSSQVIPMQLNQKSSQDMVVVWHAACLPALDNAPTPDLHTATKVSEHATVAVWRSGKARRHAACHNTTTSVKI
jgi:hypothetical protein